MRQRLSRERVHDQTELFDGLHDRPKWSDLPQHVRATLTDLAAQILRQQRRQETTPPAPEVEHE